MTKKKPFTSIGEQSQSDIERDEKRNAMAAEDENQTPKGNKAFPIIVRLSELVSQCMKEQNMTENKAIVYISMLLIQLAINHGSNKRDFPKS